MLRLALLSSLLIIFAPGCADKIPCPATPADVAHEPPPPKPHESLLKHVPSDAVGALLLRERGLGMVAGWLTGDPRMKADLAAFLTRTVGADLTELRGVAGWATDLAGTPGTLAVLLRLSRAPTPRGVAAGEHRGVKLVRLGGGVIAAGLPAGMVLGTESGVKRAIDLALGKAKALGKGSPLAGVLAEDGPKVDLLIGFAPASLPEVEGWALAARYGVETLAVTWDQGRRLQVTALGDGKKLEGAHKMLQKLIQGMLARLEGQRDAATGQDEPLAGVSAILAYHLFRKLAAEVEPKLQGDQLTAGYTVPSLDDPMVLASVVGILAAVAVPSFIKYIRKSKTVEAQVSLDSIKAGAIQYYQADLYTRRGKLRPKAFPPSSDGWYPPAVCCKQPGQKCAPVGSEAWSGSPWRALNFAMSSPHYYQYRFTSAGAGKKATFTAEARGDLDCDGIFSSYSLQGSVDREGSVVVIGPLIENEIE